jgi:hypothetical protein
MRIHHRGHGRTNGFPPDHSPINSGLPVLL